MKAKIVALCLLFGISLGANAQFGGLGGLLGGGKSSGGADPAAVEKFTVDAILVNKTVSSALLQITAALSDKEKIAAVKESFDKLNATTDPKEQGAIMGTIYKTHLAATTDLLKSEEAKARLKNLSPEMQKKVARALLNVGIAALRFKPMLDNGNSMVQSIGSNPALLAKLPVIKESISLLAEAGAKVPELVSLGFSMMKTVNVDPGNPTAESKFEPITELAVPES